MVTTCDVNSEVGLDFLATGEGEAAGGSSAFLLDEEGEGSTTTGAVIGVAGGRARILSTFW